MEILQRWTEENKNRRRVEKKKRDSVCHGKIEKVFPRKTLEVRLSDRGDIGEGE